MVRDEYKDQRLGSAGRCNWHKKVISSDPPIDGPFHASGRSPDCLPYLQVHVAAQVQHA